jgi:hypothetical protein
MDDLGFMKDLGVGGGGGIIGLILSWFGFKSQMKELRTDLDGVKQRVRFRDTCDEIVKRVEKSLESIQAMQEEMRNDIKKILN